MNIRRLATLILTTLTLFVFAASAFAQEAAEAEAAPNDISPLVFLVGAGLIVALGSYLAINTRTGKEE
jgi:hypothetical protein